MSARSPAAWTSALLRRHVVLLVEWLQLKNALRRGRAECTPGVLLLLAAGVIVIAATAAALSSRIAAACDLLAEYWVLTAVVTTVYVASSVARRRRRIHELHLQSWLVAAPIPQASVRVSQTLRTLLPMLAQLGGAALFIVMTADMPAAGTVIAAIAAGWSVGAAIGWRANVDQSDARSLALRYVPTERSRGAPYVPTKQMRGAQALSGWPIAQVLAWSRPENSRYVLIVALFAVQGGSSALVGLSVVALYFIGSYLAALFSALLQVARSASAWLRSTPMTLAEFVWLLSRRALIHQVAGTALLAVFMLLLGAPLMTTLQIVALWLSLIISISGCTLFDTYRGRSPAVKVAVCFVIWAALAAALQLRSGSRA